MPYGARIRAARSYADITQQELADALGVDVQTIKRREADTQQPKKGERVAIASVCNVPLEFLEHGFVQGVLADKALNISAQVAKNLELLELVLETLTRWPDRRQLDEWLAESEHDQRRTQDKSHEDAQDDDDHLQAGNDG